MIEGAQVLTDFLVKNVSAKIPATQDCNFGPISVYLRAGVYHYDADTGERKSAVGVVNIQITDEDAQGHGRFREFIVTLELEARSIGYEYLRFEQVQSARLRAMLVNHEYVPTAAFDDVLVLKL